MNEEGKYMNGGGGGKAHGMEGGREGGREEGTSLVEEEWNDISIKSSQS